MIIARFCLRVTAFSLPVRRSEADGIGASDENIAVSDYATDVGLLWTHVSRPAPAARASLGAAT